MGRKYTRKEYYIAFMNERAFNGPVIIASSEGGVNIEETAEKNPESIVKFPIDAVQGLTVEGSKNVAMKLGIHDRKVDEVAQILLNLYNCLFLKTPQWSRSIPSPKTTVATLFVLMPN